MHVLGTSAYVPELLMRAPEVVQNYSDGASRPKLLEFDPEAVAGALVASAGRQSDPVRAIAIARSLRRRELARIASADLLGMLDVTDVCAALSAVWVAVLQAALEAVIRANLPGSGDAPAAIAVIGMAASVAASWLRIRRRRAVRMRAGRRCAGLRRGALGDHRG